MGTTWVAITGVLRGGAQLHHGLQVDVGQGDDVTLACLLVQSLGELGQFGRAAENSRMAGVSECQALAQLAAGRRRGA